MKNFVWISFAGLIALGGCGSEEVTYIVPAEAQQACLRDVAKVTHNNDVAFVTGNPVENGADLTIGVGPQRAPWRCIAVTGGGTTGITSLTNEGAM